MTNRYLAREAAPTVRAAFAFYRHMKKLLGNRRFDGAPIALLAELVVEHHFPGMTKAPPCTPGYDFIDAEGRRVQVKGWGSERRTFDNIRRLNQVDRLIRVCIFDDGYELPVDMLTAPYGTTGGIVVYKSGRIRPYGPEYADPKKRAASLKAQQTVRARLA